MSTAHAYTAQIQWQRQGAVFTDKRYSRGHVWHFDGGTSVPASSSPNAVREPYSVAAAVDPEEAFVASIASCHMLWFLDIAARAAWVVDSYVDDAVGVMTANAQGKPWVSLVTLRPRVVFAGDKQPDATEIARLHHRAHEECFIANSVRSEVRIEPAA
jgi:organic hydroperoxide reductase OsmC/OhrA